MIVEDEASIREPLVKYFGTHQFRVKGAANAADARALLSAHTFDLVIADIMMPGEDGLSLCRHIRATSNQPVILLTARAEELDRILGLEVGADDYVTKPFSPRELIARLAAVMRRTRPALAGQTMRFEDLELDPVAHRVRRDGKEIALGPTEFRLLQHFMERPGRVLSRGQLVTGVWGHDSDIEERTVDVQVKRLRAAINSTGGRDMIRTVRSAGYSLG